MRQKQACRSLGAGEKGGQCSVIMLMLRVGVLELVLASSVYMANILFTAYRTV